MAFISLIICTCGRLESLRHTLNSLSSLQIPYSLNAELIVVDNTPGNDAADVIRSAAPASFSIIALHEPQPGKSRAMNLALASARGDILVFTDDDVRPKPDWLAKLIEPIVNDQADAVQGGVRFADQLRRSGLQEIHKSMLTGADDPTACLNPEPWLVGANMAVARKIFEKIPSFDSELGPGALGHSEDALFHMQVSQAGFRIAARMDAIVEHHFDPARLSNAFFESQATKQGQFYAYILHHWAHASVKLPGIRTAIAQARYHLYRNMAGLMNRHDKWIGKRELELRKASSFFHQYRIERNRSRNYDLRGLVKRASGSETEMPAS